MLVGLELGVGLGLGLGRNAMRVGLDPRQGRCAVTVKRLARYAKNLCDLVYGFGLKVLRIKLRIV